MFSKKESNDDQTACWTFHGLLLYTCVNYSNPSNNTSICTISTYKQPTANKYQINRTKAIQWQYHASLCMDFCLKWYFIAVGVVYKATQASGTLAACQYIVGLMAGNTARWMDRLEV